MVTGTRLPEFEENSLEVFIVEFRKKRRPVAGSVRNPLEVFI
jgi:hypothetical protein